MIINKIWVWTTDGLLKSTSFPVFTLFKLDKIDKLQTLFSFERQKEFKTLVGKPLSCAQMCVYLATLFSSIIQTNHVDSLRMYFVWWIGFWIHPVHSKPIIWWQPEVFIGLHYTYFKCINIFCQKNYILISTFGCPGNKITVESNYEDKIVNTISFSIKYLSMPLSVQH